jgi:hypothetical protein
MATEPGKEWVGTPLDADRVDPRGVQEIVVVFDEAEEVLTKSRRPRPTPPTTRPTPPWRCSDE